MPDKVALVIFVTAMIALVVCGWFLHGNQQRPLNLSRSPPLPREAKEDWAAEIVVGWLCPEKSHPRPKSPRCSRAATWEVTGSY